jgi:hypothetical protein
MYCSRNAKFQHLLVKHFMGKSIEINLQNNSLTLNYIDS